MSKCTCKSVKEHLPKTRGLAMCRICFAEINQLGPLRKQWVITIATKRNFKRNYKIILKDRKYLKLNDNLQSVMEILKLNENEIYKELQN